MCIRDPLTMRRVLHLQGSEGVQRKFSSAPYKLSRPLRLKNAYTAAEAQLEYLCNTVSPGSKIFAISGECPSLVALSRRHLTCELRARGAA